MTLTMYEQAAGKKTVEGVDAEVDRKVGKYWISSAKACSDHKESCCSGFVDFLCASQKN